MFYSNENAVGLKVVLEHDHWTEKGVYACGHVMRIKKIEGLLFVLEDDNGELTMPVNGFHLLEEQKPITEEEAEAAWKTVEREYWEGLARKQRQLQEIKHCHGTQTCPGFQEDILALTHGTRRGQCAHGGPYFGCQRSDYQEDMEAWRKCLKSNT